MKAGFKFFAIGIGLLLGIHTKMAASEPYYYTIDLRLTQPIQAEYPRDSLPHELGALRDGLTDALLTGNYSVKMLSEKVGSINGKGIYATSVKGIGFTLQVNGVDLNEERAHSQSIGQATGNLPVIATLVVYEKLPSGDYILSPSPIAEVELGEGFKPLGISLSVDQPILIKQKSCLFLSRNQHVQLQPISVEELRKNQEVFGQEFAIKLQCDADVRADVVFYDQITPSNRSDCLTVIAEPSASTNTGVCIAIKRDGDNQKVKLGETWTFSDKNPVISQPERLFSAYYVKDGEPIAGQMKAVAIISFTYH